VQAERRPAASTGRTALDYSGCMRISNIILPAFLFILAAGAGCKDETPSNTPGEFGDPCVVGSVVDSPDGCVNGLYCYEGYCEEECKVDADCQPVDGWQHKCIVGLCQILCGSEDTCPQDLGTPMTCGVVGSSRWCEAEEEDS
jgi:hypothetical protein